jgi:uncharacterized protein YbcV (DUF1398 family)
MFTKEELETAHRNVRSGADFPAYIREISALGVVRFETAVRDGETVYADAHGHEVAGGPKYHPLEIAETPDAAGFAASLKAHQEGGSDFFTFCADCARSGIHHWTVRIGPMTCTYVDPAGNEILVEQIPD